LGSQDDASIKAFFERHFSPWQITTNAGSDTGLVTGYYEPLLKGSLNPKAGSAPFYSVPDDLLVVDLARLIYDLEESGFSSRKFRVYYYSLLNKPFIFIAAVLIACFFSLGSSRNKNSILYIIAGIMFGLILYIGLSIIQAFGSSGMIPPFSSTWIISVIIISLSILLVFRKEHS
jgi:lipopolysaccharide export LptBFGC system permease protein LptF